MERTMVFNRPNKEGKGMYRLDILCEFQPEKRLLGRKVSYELAHLIEYARGCTWSVALENDISR